jgi:hypothetical protein
MLLYTRFCNGIAKLNIDRYTTVVCSYFNRKESAIERDTLIIIVFILDNFYNFKYEEEKI